MIRPVAIVVSLLVLGGCDGGSVNSEDTPEVGEAAPTTIPAAVSTTEPTQPESTTSASAVDTSRPADTTLASSDTTGVVPDPAGLRFQERLGDDMAAFVDDASLAVPELVDPRESGIEGPPPPVDQRAAEVIWIQDSQVVLRGLLGQLDDPFEESPASGEPVDIGIPGARFADEQAAAIVYPVDGGTRLIGTEDAFMFGRPDPDVSTEQLIELARTVGTTADWDATSPGNGVWLFERSTEALFERPTLVEQGPSRFVRLTRFAEPVTAEQFFAYVSLRAEPSAAAEVGDTALLANAEFTDSEVYAELLSPFDVVEVSFVTASIAELIDIAPVDDLDRAFDGVVDIPPRP